MIHDYYFHKNAKGSPEVHISIWYIKYLYALLGKRKTIDFGCRRTDRSPIFLDEIVNRLQNRKTNTTEKYTARQKGGHKNSIKWDLYHYQVGDLTMDTNLWKTCQSNWWYWPIGLVSYVVSTSTTIRTPINLDGSLVIKGVDWNLEDQK